MNSQSKPPLGPFPCPSPGKSCSRPSSDLSPALQIKYHEEFERSRMGPSPSEGSEPERRSSPESGGYRRAEQPHQQHQPHHGQPAANGEWGRAGAPLHTPDLRLGSGQIPVHGSAQIPVPETVLPSTSQFMDPPKSLFLDPPQSQFRIHLNPSLGSTQIPVQDLAKSQFMDPSTSQFGIHLKPSS